MTPDQTKHFEEALLAEKATLERELATVGRKNPDNPSDWEATEIEADAIKADPNDTADSIEAFESNNAILSKLEPRLGDVVRALGKITAGTYGTCEIGNEPIEEDRLEANPAARTCKAHMNDESALS